MKTKFNRLLFIMVFWFLFIVSSVQAQSSALGSQVLAFSGKSYSGVQDPEYISYDLALREFMAQRIHKKFGIILDSKKYSGFDLLEIGAFFKCKKSDEPFELFLKMFPRYP